MSKSKLVVLTVEFGNQYTLGKDAMWQTGWEEEDDDERAPSHYGNAARRDDVAAGFATLAAAEKGYTSVAYGYKYLDKDEPVLTPGSSYGQATFRFHDGGFLQFGCEEFSAADAAKLKAWATAPTVKAKPAKVKAAGKVAKSKATKAVAGKAAKKAKVKRA